MRDSQGIYMSDDKIIDQVLAEDAAERRLSTEEIGALRICAKLGHTTTPEILLLLIDSEKALRQQLADVSNERDGCREIAENNAKCAGELTAKLNSSEARNAELERILGGMLFAFDDGVGQDWSAPLLDYARKHCKAVEYVDYPNAEIAADAAAGLHDIDFPGPDEEKNDAPATDEQGAGSRETVTLHPRGETFYRNRDAD